LVPDKTKRVFGGEIKGFLIIFTLNQRTATFGLATSADLNLSSNCDFTIPNTLQVNSANVEKGEENTFLYYRYGNPESNR